MEINALLISEKQFKFSFKFIYDKSFLNNHLTWKEDYEAVLKNNECYCMIDDKNTL